LPVLGIDEVKIPSFLGLKGKKREKERESNGFIKYS
jgi:hypothetical protein